MKAAVIERYGPPEVVVIKDVEKPVAKDNEVLVRVRATTVNSGDARVRALRVPRGLSLMMRFALGFSGPKQPIGGFDAAGEVEAVGSKVTKFKRGDRVLASRGFAFGCHAEYLTVAEDGTIALIPEGMSYVDAVALPFGAATSLIFFGEGKLKAGESIVVNAAAGAVGSMAVQIAKQRGLEVTAICSARNAELVRSLGADHVIDYAKEDVTRSQRQYDVFMENHGNLPYGRVKHLLKPGGRFLMVIADLFGMVVTSRNQAVMSGKEQGDVLTGAGYARILDMAASGKIRPVIDSSYPFEQIVEAHRRVDGGHKAGSVVVTVP